MLLPRLVAHLGHYCVQRCNYCCRKDNKDNVALHLHAAIAMMLQNSNYNNYLTGYSKEMAIKALKCCRWQCHCLPQSYPLFVCISHRDHLHVFTALMNAHSSQRRAILFLHFLLPLSPSSAFACAILPLDYYILYILLVFLAAKIKIYFVILSFHLTCARCGASGVRILGKRHLVKCFCDYAKSS